MHLVFVHTHNRFAANHQMFGVHFMPVWAYTLAAHLEGMPAITCQLFDERFEDDTTVQKGDVFLFSGINQDLEWINQLLGRLRKRFPHALFALGGPICWSLNTAGKIDQLTHFDYLFIGDGEETFPQFIQALSEKKPWPKITQAPQRFDLTHAKPMQRHLLGSTLGRYYGAVLEVSRGCPFLCEFCDIRILPDNNRSHVKPASLIVEELDFMARSGVKQVLFACDNFIGNPAWAEEVCEAIVQWKRKSGLAPSLYTWLTIDLSRRPKLMNLLRAAGFDMFFIGVESFNQSSLLETAKVQNTSLQLVEAIRTIQSYGFIVVAGLIFGFDTDPDNVVKITLKGIQDAGLISGDPSLLTALPGTPLYRRLQLSGRLRDGKKLGLGGFKYQTNIRYLKPTQQIQDDFQSFVREFNRGPYQLSRLLSFYRCLESPNYKKSDSPGYVDAKHALTLVLRNRVATTLMVRRLFRLFRSPSRIAAIFRAMTLTWRQNTPERPLWTYFKFWLFNWSNSLFKYHSLSSNDFDIEWVGPDYDLSRVLPQGYEGHREEPIPESKIRAQRKSTTDALKAFVAQKKE